MTATALNQHWNCLKRRAICTPFRWYCSLGVFASIVRHWRRRSPNDYIIFIYRSLDLSRRHLQGR